MPERPTAEELNRLYHGERLSLREIAKRLGCGGTTVLGWMNCYGIERRERVEALFPDRQPRPSPNDLFRWYCDERQTTTEIGLHCGVSHATVNAWLRKSGISLRPIGPIPPKWNPQRLYEMYHKEKKSIAEISKISGHSIKTITRLFRVHRIPVRTLPEARKLAFREGRAKTPPDRASHMVGKGSIDAAHQWLRDHPDEVRRNLRRALAIRNKDRQRQTVPCSWCGERLRIVPNRMQKQAHFFCGSSHFGSFNQLSRFHPGTPRPLLMDKLRELCPLGLSEERIRRQAAEIGAGEVEIVELLLERLETPTHAVQTLPLPAQPETAQPKRKPRAINPKEVGALGEALLKAQKEIYDDQS